MRPCDHCGAPIDNSDLFCSACLPRLDSDAKQVTHRISYNDTIIRSGTSTPKDHWALMFIGSFLCGIPAAFCVAIGSQLVTLFQMDIALSGQMAFFVLCFYGVAGGLGELIEVAGNRTKLAIAAVFIVLLSCFVWWWFDKWRSLRQADAARDMGTLQLREAEYMPVAEQPVELEGTGLSEFRDQQRAQPNLLLSILVLMRLRENGA